MNEFISEEVSVVRCTSYEECRAAIDESLRLIGGIERFIKKGDRVLIKPNLVSKKKPYSAITTNPDFLHAVICAVEEAGGRVIIAESPGGPYNRGILKALYDVCGITEAVKGTNAELNFDTSFTEVEYPDGRTVKRLPIIDPVLNADVIISLPKLKTHAMTGYTGAVKNLFGVIPGTYKAELHFRLDERESFCSMLVDLCSCVRPTLSIMDGIIGMEGDGPTSGKDRYIGVVMASANPYSLDMAACDIIGYAPEEIATVKESCRRGLTADKPEQLNIVGVPLDEVRIPDFLKPESHFNLLKLINLPSALNSWLTNALASRPVIDHKQCVSCGECARCCPPKAISMETGVPVIDRGRCIRCFCCQELCPRSAVKIKRPLANRLMINLLK